MTEIDARLTAIEEKLNQDAEVRLENNDLLREIHMVLAGEGLKGKDGMVKTVQNHAEAIHSLRTDVDTLKAVPDHTEAIQSLQTGLDTLKNAPAADRTEKEKLLRTAVYSAGTVSIFEAVKASLIYLFSVKH